MNGNKVVLANISEISTITSICLTIAVIFKYLVYNNKIIVSNEIILLFLLAMIPLTTLVKMIGKKFGKKIFMKFDSLMEVHIFNVTKGDNREITRIEKSCGFMKECIWFIANTFISIILSVIFIQ